VGPPGAERGARPGAVAALGEAAAERREAAEGLRGVAAAQHGAAVARREAVAEQPEAAARHAVEPLHAPAAQCESAQAQLSATGPVATEV